MLYKVKLGQPRNKSLLRLLEDPVNRRRRSTRRSSSFYHDRHAQGRALRPQGRAVFHHRRARPGSRLVRAGPRPSLTQTIPDAFVLPDLMTAFAEIDIRTDIDDAAKEKAKARVAG